MSGFRVVICGGGVAAVEGMVRLHRLAGERVDVTVIAPEEDLVYRPLAVKEFASKGRTRHPLREIVESCEGTLVKDKLGWIDRDRRTIHTTGGEPHPYDACLIAIGAHMNPAPEHIGTFTDANADERFTGIVRDIEEATPRAWR